MSRGPFFLSVSPLSLTNPVVVKIGKNNYPRCLFTTLDVFRRGFIIFVLGFIVLICFLCCFFGEGEVWKDIHEEELDP